MEAENAGLKRSVEELKAQISMIRQLYNNEDIEDGKKILKMEVEIRELKEEKGK